jgi:hypothetical protein
MDNGGACLNCRDCGDAASLHCEKEGFRDPLRPKSGKCPATSNEVSSVCVKMPTRLFLRWRKTRRVDHHLALGSFSPARCAAGILLEISINSEAGDSLKGRRSR